MDIDFSKVFHQSSQDGSKGHPPISEDSNDWPEAWKVQNFKAYSRFPKIPLPDEKVQADFCDLVSQRRSRRDYGGKQSISLNELAVILKYSCGIFSHDVEGGLSGRAQPSAGGRFPIEIYPFVLVSGKDMPSGWYHYDVMNHQLEVVRGHIFEKADIQNLFRFEWINNASMVLVMTAIFERNQMKYGERGYRYILLEAGHIGQNIHLAVEALGLKCCALGGTRDRNIEKALDIDGVNESVVYAFSIGR